MARLKPKEFDPTMLLKIQKHQADTIINAEKVGEEVAGRKEDAQNFLDTWRLNNLGTKDSGALPPVDAVPPHLRGWIFKRAEATPQKDLMIAGDLGPGDMWGPTEGGFFLTDEDGIHGHVYQNEGGYLKEGNMYDEGIHGLPIPRVQLKIDKGQKVAMSPADVPLGDGMIYEAKTQMQKNLKQKYDVMLENGFIDQVEYQKQMKRLFGNQKK